MGRPSAYMANPWVAHGFTIGLPCWLMDHPCIRRWVAHGSPMVRPWSPVGIYTYIADSRVVHGCMSRWMHMALGHPWVVHECPLVLDSSSMGRPLIPQRLTVLTLGSRMCRQWSPVGKYCWSFWVVQGPPICIAHDLPKGLQY